MELHSGYYAGSDAPAWSPTRSTSAVLSGLRATLLEGCVIAFTGLVADQSEEVLANPRPDPRPDPRPQAWPLP